MMTELDKKLGPIEAQQQMEQYDAMMANIAPIVGTYYTKLLDSGVPADLAYQLVMDWHSLWWRSVMRLKGD